MRHHPKAAATVLIIAALSTTSLAQGATGKTHKPGATATPATTPAATTPASTKPAAAPRPAGSSERLDGIAAVVNDDVILQSDVEEQLYLFLSQARARPDSATVDSMRTEVLKQLIDFRLVVAEAKRQGLSLSPSDDKMIAKQAEESLTQTKSRFQSEEEFQQAMVRDNTTEAKLREKYKSDLSEQVLAERLKDKALPKKPVTQAEAEAFFRANPGKFPQLPAQLKIQVLQIPPAADSVADSKAHARILDIRKRIVAGEKFAKVAADASEDENTARSGGDLGFLPRGALDVALDKAVAAARLNELSTPVRSSAGWHVFEVLERDTLKTAAGSDSLDHLGQPVPEAHVRHILVRVQLNDDDIARARRLADRVRAEAEKGADFGTLVRRYSKYQGNADPDGDLGYVAMTAFQNEIRAALDTVAVGHVSQVLENPIGFNIFKVNDRKPARPYELSEVKDQLQSAVEEIKDHDRWDVWVKALRDKAHVEIRGS